MRVIAIYSFFIELAPGNGVELTSFTLKNVPWFEKYRMLASLTFFSAAWGFTISRPCVKRLVWQSKQLITVDDIKYLERSKGHRGSCTSHLTFDSCCSSIGLLTLQIPLEGLWNTNFCLFINGRTSDASWSALAHHTTGVTQIFLVSIFLNLHKNKISYAGIHPVINGKSTYFSEGHAIGLFSHFGLGVLFLHSANTLSTTFLSRGF